jgi:hypothetical protein
MLRSLRRLVSAVTLVAFAASGAVLVPPAFDAWRILRDWDEPEVAAALHLDGLAPADYAREAEQALREDDPELARSILALAAERRVALPPDLAGRVEEAVADEPGTVGQILEGAVFGEGDTAASFGAALATDLMVIGDVRDLVRQAAAYPDYDPVVVALAALGVGLTAATVSSAGAASPVKLGASVLKLAKRTGKLSIGLGDDLLRLARRAVDADALQAVLRAARRLDWAEARRLSRSVLRRDVGAELARSGEALGGIAAVRGPRAALDTLGAAESTVELRRLARVSEKSGAGYRGALRLAPRLAKGVAKVSEVFLKVAGWLLAGLGWLLWLAWVALRLLYRCGRLALRAGRFATHRARPRPHAAEGAFPSLRHGAAANPARQGRGAASTS